MRVIPAGGRFLHELSMVERAQPHGLVTGVWMSTDTARVQCGIGRVVTIPFIVGRAQIAQLLSQATGPLVPPSEQEPQVWPDAPDPQQLWSELLDDIGAYLEDLSHANPHLRLVGVHRDGPIARIEVTNGVREFTYEVPLDSGEMPAAVTVDIARVFPSDPSGHAR